MSLLDDQTSSLVGVAISASLLPPAVNAGVIWVAHGFVARGWLVIDDDEDALKKAFTTGGIVSLLLTIANVILIIVSSMLMFRMKEVSHGRQ